MCHSQLYNSYFLLRQAGKSRRTLETEIHNCIFQTHNQNKLIFDVSFSFLKVSIVTVTKYWCRNISFSVCPSHSLQSLHTSYILFFSFQLLLYLSINPIFHRSKHGFQSLFLFFPRRKGVVFLILFTAVQGDGSLMALIKLFSYRLTLSYPFQMLYVSVLKLIL